MGRKSSILEKIAMEELVEKCNNEGVAEVAKNFGVTRAAIYHLLKGRTPNNNGGKIAKSIPAHELHKDVALVNAEMETIAEKNAQNACVVLESCEVRLAGTVGMYTLHSKPGEVVAMFGESMVKLPISDVETVIEELKAVCRSAKSFDFGNAMW